MSFRRALNASFLVRDVQIISFLYRAILAMIRGDRTLNKTQLCVVETEFTNQFGAEFKLTAKKLKSLETPFNWDQDWFSIEANVRGLEETFPLYSWLRNSSAGGMEIVA